MSLIVQLFTVELFNTWWSFGESVGATPADLVCTFTEYTAASIADAYKRFAPGHITQVGELIAFSHM